MTDYTILVNKNNPLDRDFVPDNLVTIDEPTGSKIDVTYINKLEKEAYLMFKEMQQAALKEGFQIYVDSSYRSYEYQERVFNDIVQKRGMDYAVLSVAKPGHSEHQTGLAIDIIFMRDGQMIENFDDSFEEIIWLKNNCYKFGFILRYPENKEDVTGFMYEMWHYRFVGEDVSKKMHDSGIETLEEYVTNNRRIKNDCIEK